MTGAAAVAVLPVRQRALIASCIVLVCAIAWAYLASLHREMASSVATAVQMAKMGMRMEAPWSAADVFFTFTMWAVMMVGMMSASAAPAFLLFAAAHARRAERSAPTAVLMFGFGYIAVWVGFSACATLVQWALHNAALLSPAMSVTSMPIAGVLLIGAGVYQLTPSKRACLTHCQSPVGFLMSHWREGTGGAFQMGLRHGLYCVGCCWALMVVLFAVGVMNLVWVAVLTVFILIEKLGGMGAHVARFGGVVLVVFGLVLVTRSLGT